jgi:hypothetical protein
MEVRKEIVGIFWKNIIGLLRGIYTPGPVGDDDDGFIDT